MKAILVAGARPNFIKIAPLVRAIDEHNGEPAGNAIHYVLVHTGQHYDYEMSQIFFKELKLPKPHIHLGIGSGTHAEQTGKIMIEFERVLLKEKTDIVIVVGDVNSTLAAALASVKMHIPVAHVEAGIRSYDYTMPEEINRRLTDHISDYLFTTSKYDDDSLAKEGISTEKIFRVGNIMVDSLIFTKPLAEKSKILSRLGLGKQDYALVTLHRPSNVDDRQRLTHITNALKEISRKIPVIFPVHPRTRKNIISFGLDQFFSEHDIRLIEPLGYLDFLKLELYSKLVITDSGGIQVETTAMDIPCLTVLDTPVWVITHKQGTNILVGSDGKKLISEATRVIRGNIKKRGKRPEFWDGNTAERIIKILASR